MKALDRWLALGVDWEPGDELTGWLLSEKLNGCRAFWDGANLWSRGGKRVTLPAHIRATLPEGVRLDGELWAGREGFTEARVAVQFGRWTPRCRFTVFDAPDSPGTWAQRIAEAGRLYADCVGFTVCESLQHANAMLLEVQSAGGEGLVFRSPIATGYERGRSRNFVKVKGHLYTC